MASCVVCKYMYVVKKQGKTERVSIKYKRERERERKRERERERERE